MVEKVSRTPNMEFHLMIHFRLVFSQLNPEELQQCFLQWVESISQITFGEIVAIDGKTLLYLTTAVKISQLFIWLVLGQQLMG